MRPRRQRGEALLAQALRLDETDRAELAAEFLASLESRPIPAAEAEWTTEIERRVASIESGVAVLESWDDVRRQVERALVSRSKLK